MSFVKDVTKLHEKAEVEVRQKRIISGMELHELKKKNYVVLSASDYDKLVQAASK